MNTIDIAFKHIPIGVEFDYKGQMYMKTNHNRGRYIKGSKTIHKSFKKKTVVNTTSEYFDVRA